MSSQTVLFRSTLQYNLAIQVFDELSLTPTSNDLTFVFE